MRNTFRTFTLYHLIIFLYTSNPYYPSVKVGQQGKQERELVYAPIKKLLRFPS
jgi:hypothetical protein